MNVNRFILLICVATLALAVVACDDGGETPAAESTQPAGPPTTPPTRDTGTATPAITLHTPVPTRLASAAGRDDCPGGWLEATIGAYSVCYPADHYASVATLPSDGRERLAVRLIAGPPVAQTSYLIVLGSTASYAPPTVCQFDAETVDRSAETAIAPYSVAGADGSACTARTSYAVQFKGAVPIPPGALDFDVNASSDDQLELAKRILATARAR